MKKMMITKPTLSQFSLFTSLVLLLCSCPIQADVYNFLKCLSQGLEDSTEISSVVYTPSNPSYSTVLNASIRNKRYLSESYPKPQVIITPVQESQIPPVVLCAKDNGLQIRTRSGGHDFQGLSFISEIPYVIIDLFRLNEIDVDSGTKTAWVQTGVTNGQVYHKIYTTNATLGFPGGGCLTIGVGGLYSGGGYGAMMRKHGLAIDNIIDARIVDVNGRILDRKSMGEDLFWAIRGGGGDSFGVITAWKLQLVTMPDIVSFFMVSKTLEDNLTDLFHKWQTVASSIDNELFISIFTSPIDTTDGGRTILASFGALYLGRKAQLLQLITKKFPELNVKDEDCNEITWIQAALVFGGYSPAQSPDVMTSRNPTTPAAVRITQFSFKAKLDFVDKPMPKYAIDGLWKVLLKRKPDAGEFIFVPYGGKMAEIPETATPFPHRAGNLYMIEELVYWNHTGKSATSLRWIRKLYKYLAPHVSKNPRRVYKNYRDLDLGVNSVTGNTSYKHASAWGLKYFNGNFKRLAQIKSVVDPSNFFKFEQSIPLLKSKIEEEDDDMLEEPGTYAQDTASM